MAFAMPYSGLLSKGVGMVEERRAKADRRALDIGPPNGWHERRKHVERRLSAAEEAELTPEEFVAYFGATAKVATNVDHQLDLAAEVLDRVRDRY
jgi:hypothetical protein